MGLEPATAGAETPDRRWCGAAIAAAAGLAAAWLAAGSTGLLAYPLRHGLCWAALGVAVLAAWPRREKGDRPRLVGLVLAAALAVFLIASPLPPVGVLAVALVMLALARGLPAADRTAIHSAAEAIVILGVYRLAYTSIPLVWYGSNALGEAIGWAAGAIIGRPLWVGATMAGVDYLVPMLYLAVALPLRWPGRRGGRSAAKAVCLAVGAVLAGHFLYLLDLAALAGHPATNWILPAGLAQVFPKAWKELIEKPWDLPALAAAIQCAIAFGFFWRFRNVPDSERIEPEPAQRRPVGLGGLAATAAVSCLATILPVLCVLCWARPDPTDKKVVLFEKGFLNWLRPQHGEYGRLSVGMYGMLPTFLESLGMRAVVSPDLSEGDLRDADTLVVIYPNKPWSEETLGRIESFVRGGGTLMVVGDHTIQEDDGGNRMNDVLAPTAMRVAFDSAEFAIGGWLQSYEAMSHPTSAGIDDQQNQFGVVIGASVEAHWPARPLLVGRFGWADSGDVRNVGGAMLGDRRYDPGEKLGDMVLAAEQPLGAGKVICFGDTSMFTNGLTVGCHEYTSRLFAYLAAGGETPQATWRQLVGLDVAVLLLVALIWQPLPWRLVAAALPLAISLLACTAVTHRAWELTPDGGRKTPNNLAYIDSGHLNANDPESWRDDGLGGLHLTLMRDGYLVLLLPELTAERLGKARLLFVDAPEREYSSRECQVVEDFVKGGGILIWTVGWDRIGPSRAILARLGFHVGLPKDQEGQPVKPRPLGWFKGPFFQGDNYYAFVRFHAAWPVYCDDATALMVSQYEPGRAVILVRRLGKGLVAVIGDTCFAMNKNLEHEDGSPFEGVRENAIFWRWFTALLREGMDEGKPWYPPNPNPDAAGKKTGGP